VRLNVDLKSEEPALVERFIAIVREHQAEERVIAASFFRSTLSSLRRAGWRGESSLSRAEFLYWGLVPKWLQRGTPAATRAQIPTHAGPLQLATPGKLEKLRQLGLRVDYWTINDPNEARRLVALGADGIMTDDPARIVPVVRAGGG
jgi:glycerophosphoryl diester phosphodiesterase